LILIPSEGGYCSSETKQEKSGAKEKIVRFGEEITGTELTHLKTALGSSPGEYFGFRDNKVFYHIQ
jgi:hypothetical protein